MARRKADDEPTEATAPDGTGNEEERPQTPRAGEGTPPKTGEEGGVVEEGTGDFAPDADPSYGSGGDDNAPETVKTTTRDGSEVQAEVGVDGENPVTPQNPPAKAVLGGGKPVENEDAEPRGGKGVDTREDDEN